MLGNMENHENLALDDRCYGQDQDQDVDLLDFDGIVCNCLHQATAMLKDSEECRQRKMSRLQLLVDLLSTANRQQGKYYSLAQCQLIIW